MSITIKDDVRLSMISLFGHGAYNKTFPNYFLYTPADFRWGLLSGLIDTDGNVCVRYAMKKGKLGQNKSVSYATQSWALATNVQLLCMSLGINASLSLCYRKGRYEFIVAMSTIDTYDMREYLCCATSKKEIIDKFTFNGAPNPKNIIPFPPKYRDMCPCARDRSSNDVVISNAMRNGYITRDSFYKICPASVIDLANSEYNITARWERVIKIVSLPDSHTVDTLIDKIKEAKHDNKKSA
jgi:hypothetical protein